MLKNQSVIDNVKMSRNYIFIIYKRKNSANEALKIKCVFY